MIYFAYGSNMDWKQLHDRCPMAEFMFKATLPDYALKFTHQRIKNRGGAADVVECQGEIVWGVIYQLNDLDLRGLYSSEGYQPGRTRNSYAPISVTVYRDGASDFPVTATTFTVCRKLAPHQKPSREYLDHILAGAKHWNLPNDYQMMLQGFETRP
jgi:gamma-glutamylcyclotransferase